MTYLPAYSLATLETRMPAAALIDDETLAEALELSPAQLAELPDYLLVFARELLAS